MPPLAGHAGKLHTARLVGGSPHRESTTTARSNQDVLVARRFSSRSSFANSWACAQSGRRTAAGGYGGYLSQADLARISLARSDGLSVPASGRPAHLAVSALHAVLDFLLAGL